MSTMPIFHTRRNHYEPFSGNSYPLNGYLHESAIETKHSHAHPRPHSYAHPRPHSHAHPHPHSHSHAHPQPRPYPHAHLHPHQHPHVLSPIPTNHHNHHHRDANNGFMANSRVEWREGPDAYFIWTELPGIRREDVKVTIQEDEKLLKISGFRNMEYEDDTYDNWNHVEQSGGKFMTAFVLPEDATVGADQVKITMENGVLNATLPKRMSKVHGRPTEIVV